MPDVSVSIPSNSIRLSVPTTVSLSAQQETSQQPSVASGVATIVTLSPQNPGEVSELESGRLLNVAGFGLAVKDNARQKLLSVERIFLSATHVGYTQNMALRIDGIPTTLNQFIPIKSATILSVSATQKDTIGTEYQIELYRNDTQLLGSIQITAGTTALTQSGLNLDLDEGDKLTIFLNSDEPVENPIVAIELAWRA